MECSWKASILFFLFCCGTKLRLTIPFNIFPVTISFLLSFVSVVDVILYLLACPCSYTSSHLLTQSLGLDIQMLIVRS